MQRRTGVTRELASQAELCVEVAWTDGDVEEDRLVKRIIGSDM